MSENLPPGVDEVHLEQWDNHETQQKVKSDERSMHAFTESTSEGFGNESFVPVDISSDSGDEHRDNSKIEGKDAQKDQDTNEEEEDINSSDFVDPNGLSSKFQKFLAEKQQCVLQLDESRVQYVPPTLRAPINTIITKLKRWTLRNPTGASLSALQILAERLDEFLDLQTQRDNSDYEARCRDLLSMIYQNTIEAQRLARKLKDAATPRSLDEYE